MIVVKTISPYPNNFTRFLKHSGFTFKLSYKAIFQGANSNTALQAELFSAKVLSDNGWVEVATNEDLTVADFDIKDYGNDHPHSIAKLRSDTYFSDAQNHIEMLYSQDLNHNS